MSIRGMRCNECCKNFTVILGRPKWDSITIGKNFSYEAEVRCFLASLSVDAQWTSFIRNVLSPLTEYEKQKTFPKRKVKRKCVVCCVCVCTCGVVWCVCVCVWCV